MRKRYRVVLLAAIVAALIVPVGFALSLESSASTAVAPHAVVTTASTAPVASSLVLAPSGVNADDTPFTHPLPDAAKLLLVGTTLFGLAAAVRKAI